MRRTKDTGAFVVCEVCWNLKGWTRCFAVAMFDGNTANKLALEERLRR